jgi:hypothetical protein
MMSKEQVMQAVIARNLRQHLYHGSKHDDVLRLNVQASMSTLLGLKPYDHLRVKAAEI